MGIFKYGGLIEWLSELTKGRDCIASATKSLQDIII